MPFIRSVITVDVWTVLRSSDGTRSAKVATAANSETACSRSITRTRPRNGVGIHYDWYVVLLDNDMNTARSGFFHTLEEAQYAAEEWA